MWGVLISAVAIVLLGAGGLPILQTMALIASLPFAVGAMDTMCNI